MQEIRELETKHSLQLNIHKYTHCLHITFNLIGATTNCVDPSGRHYVDDYNSKKK